MAARFDPARQSFVTPQVRAAWQLVRYVMVVVVGLWQGLIVVFAIPPFVAPTPVSVA